MRLAALGIAAACAACWTNAPPAAPAAAGAVDADARELVAAGKRFEDAMCACEDQRCVEHVTFEMTRWSRDMARRHPEPPKMSDAQWQEAAVVGEVVETCVERAIGGAAIAAPGAPAPAR